MKLKHTLKAKANLSILLGPQIKLLSKDIGTLLEELEREAKENSYVVHSFGKGLRSFFYEDQPHREVPARQQMWESVLSQLRAELDSFEFEIAQAILNNLDEKGFFVGNEEEVAKSLGIHKDVVEDIREFIMTELEPVGIASKSYEEFILVQIREMYPEDSELTKKVVEYFRTGKTDERLRKVLMSIRLTPFEQGEVVYRGGSVDLIIERDQDAWLILLADDFVEFSVDERTPQSQEEREKKSRALKIKSILDIRKNILKRSAELIVERQEGFLLGKDPLKALTLGELAQELGVSLSAVSRAISNKYVKTPVGVYPLRFFFQRRIKDGYSKEEILRAIKEVISEGEKLSDAKVCELLRKRGINIARRTVCKYRRMLKAR
ncbi:RNA polymerase factor sigma-54 [Thermocrinis sp.]